LGDESIYGDIEVENVTKTYGTGENMVRALDGVSFSVKKGEFIAIVGPSVRANPHFCIF